MQFLKVFFILKINYDWFKGISRTGYILLLTTLKKIFSIVLNYVWERPKSPPKINIIFLLYQNVFFVNVKRFFFNFYFDPSALNSKMWHHKLNLLPQFLKFIYKTIRLKASKIRASKTYNWQWYFACSKLRSIFPIWKKDNIK